MSGWQTALLVLIAVLCAVDAYYTRKWLNASRRELEEIKRLSRLAGLIDDDEGDDV